MGWDSADREGEWPGAPAPGRAGARLATVAGKWEEGEQPCTLCPFPWAGWLLCCSEWPKFLPLCVVY